MYDAQRSQGSDLRTAELHASAYRDYMAHGGEDCNASQPVLRTSRMYLLHGFHTRLRRSQHTETETSILS